MQNISIFELIYPTFKIDKPIRLIELFAGVGSQAMALRNIGADFEHHKISEWEVCAFKSYKAIHCSDDNTDYSKDYSRKEIIETLFVLGISNDGKEPMTLEEIARKSEDWQRETYNNIRATNNLVNIMKIKGKDLEIIDTEKYEYILTYSFPCQDLSLAGNREGMSKGSGTRSGLLWEVERLLNEVEELPQVLLMENVPQVISQANIADFHKWQKFLEDKGYSNYTDTINAKDYGVAQNRNRTFMVSILGEYSYTFPKPIPLTKTIKDYLESEVDEKYYIKNEKAQELINQLIESGQLEGKQQEGVILSERGTKLEKFTDCASTLMARDYKGFGNQGMNAVIEPLLVIDYRYDEGCRVRKDGTSPALNACKTGSTSPSGQTLLVEPMIVASRGRNKENPSDRTPGAEVEQRLEPNSQGICNTLTSVQKDNYVLEPAILTPKRTEYGKSIRKDYESGKVKESRHNMTELHPREDGICNTLTTVQKDNLLLEPQYLIRKLTPLECWRLMGFSDEDFYKAQEVNSNTQLYKQAGNSIVVDVLEGIFKQMM